MAGLAERIPLSRKTLYRTIFLFGFLNGLGFLINGRPYLPSASAAGEALFKYTAFVTHFLLLSLLLVLVLFVFSALVRLGWAAKLLSVFIFSLAQVFIFVDVRVFAHFRFHLSGIVLEAMTTPGYWDSMHFSLRDWVFCALGVVGLLAGEFSLFTAICRRLKRGGWLWTATAARYSLVLVGLVLFFTLAEKVSYGVCDLYNYTPIVRYEKILPLYRPLTFKRMTTRFVGERPELSEKAVKITSASQLNYPLRGFRSERLPHPYNVIIIVVESLRFDMLNQEVMPNLSSFGRRALICLNHYSGGNTSRFGGFALIYGLYGTYWHRILSNQAGPVLIKQLLDNDYLFKVMSSTDLQYPEFNQTLFVDLDIELDDHFPGEDSCERDEVMVEEYLDWLKSVPPDRHFFSFLFLDSPHTSYYFKEQFKKFEPCCAEISFIKTNLRQHREEIFNRYRNAVHYADHSLGRILRALEAGGFLEKSIIVVTGDHGQEFWEEGYYGHNAAYTEYQTRVPLVLYIPGKQGPRLLTEMTSHLDIPVTILKALGDPNDPGLYTLGYDILGEERADFLVLSGWDDCCLITPRLKMRFSTEAYNFFDSGVTDREDQPVPDRELIKEEKDKYLLPALEGMSKFLN